MSDSTISLAVAGEERILFRLLQLYYFESSRWSSEDLQDDGLYDCSEEGLASYMQREEGMAAYLVRVEGRLAGFALTERYEFEGQTVDELADLFVLPKYRGRGIATQLIEQLVLPAQHPWLIAVFREDAQALRFWQRAFERLPFRSMRPWEVASRPQFHLFRLNESPA